MDSVLNLQSQRISNLPRCPYCGVRLPKRHSNHWMNAVGFSDSLHEAISEIHIQQDMFPFLDLFKNDDQEFDDDGWCLCQICQNKKYNRE